MFACFCCFSSPICALNRRKIYYCTAVVFVCLLLSFTKKAITALVAKVPPADLITVFILVPLSLLKSCPAALTTRCRMLCVVFFSYLISYNYSRTITWRHFQFYHSESRSLNVGKGMKGRIVCLSLTRSVKSNNYCGFLSKGTRPFSW